jgi:hypothetical protein
MLSVAVQNLINVVAASVISGSEIGRVCTDDLNAGVAFMKSAQDGV